MKGKKSWFSGKKISNYSLKALSAFLLSVFILVSPVYLSFASAATRTGTTMVPPVYLSSASTAAVTGTTTAQTTSTTNPVQINDVYPVDGSKGIAINSPIGLLLDRNVTVGPNSGGITVVDSSGTKVAIDVQVVNDVLIIYPQQYLKYATLYKVTVPQNAVADFSGNTLAADYIFSFTTGKEYTRLGGSNRYDTSIQISQAGWFSSNVAVLATGQDFPDALSAGPLATYYGAPLLLTTSSQLYSGTLTEIKRLGVKQIYIIGGYGAVSQGIETQLKGMGILTARIQGKDRYQTSLAIAGQLPSPSEVFVATGEKFPDALSIASYAASEVSPILLTPSNGLPTGFTTYLSNNNVNKAYVIGGTGVVSDSVFKQLPNATRIAGTDRYETNLKVLQNFTFDYTNAFFATGANFPDALSGSAVAGLMNSPIILVSSNMPSDVVSTIKLNYADQILMKYTLGGTGVVPDSVVTALFK